MALDDFDTHDSASDEVAKPIVAAAPAPAPAVATKRPASPEDEDLFDFPVVEMQFESDATKKPAPPPQPASAAIKSVAIPAPELRAPSPAPAPVPAPAAAATAKPSAGAAPAAPAKAASVKPVTELAQAAQLVEDLEEVLDAEPRPRKRAAARQGPAPLTLVAIGALLLINLLGLLFLWNSSNSLQSGVQAMNDRIVQSLRLQSNAPIETAPTTTAAPAPAPGARTPIPLEAFEMVTLQMAREEIQAGEYAAARRRLSRLLASADRIEPEVREDIEAQASFLLANTYRKQAEAAREKSP